MPGTVASNRARHQLLSPPALLGRVGGALQSILVTGQLAGLLIVPILVPGLLSMAAYFDLSAAAVVVLVIYAAFALNKPGRRPLPAAAAAEPTHSAPAHEPACD